MFDGFGRLRDFSRFDNATHEVGIETTSKFEGGIILGLTYRRGISTAASDHSFALSLQKRL